MISYISSFFSFSFLVWIVTKIKLYHEHYISRALEFKQAKYLLESSACTDTVRREVLIEKCNGATRILFTKPWVAAIFDTAEDLQLPMYSNLHKIVIWAIILAIVLLFAGYIQIGRDRQESRLNHWRLPIKVEHVD